MLLTLGRAPGADDSDGITAVSIENHDESAAQSEPDGSEPPFVQAMSRVVDGLRERVLEDLAGFVEADAVLREVRGRFVGVPFESQFHTWR